MIASQIIITSVSVYIFTISRKVIYVVESCRGRGELFYALDYFHDFNYHSLATNACSYVVFDSYYVCPILKIFHLLSMINVIDIFIIFRIAISVKSQTLSVTSLLSSKALQQRKR